MKKIILRSALFVLFFNYGCCDSIEERELYVNNHSPDTIYSILSHDDDFGGSDYHTSFRLGTPNLFIFQDIAPGAKVANHDIQGNWEHYFKSLPDGKMRLFVVNKDSVKLLGWDKIFRNQIYSRKYTLTLDEIKDSDWIINYPK